MQIQVPTPDKPRRFLTYPGYQVQLLPESGPDGLEAFHFVVKRSYEIVADGVAQPAKLQRVLNLSDVYFEEDDPLNCSIRYETDLLPPKPACDVVINGHCYAPGGQAVRCLCGFGIGKVKKTIRAIGARSVWLPKGGQRAGLTPARPFSVMPLRWEYAFGGVDAKYSAGPLPYPQNPVGCGFWAQEHQWAEGRDRYGPLPGFEYPDRPIDIEDLLVSPEKLGDGPRPAGLGWVPKHWEPRASRAGMDPKLRSLWERMHANPPPGAGALPFKEMSARFLNGAPDDQIIPFPEGGETVSLTHLHPTEAELRFRLPADRPRLRFDCGPGMQPVKVRIDTLSIEPDVMALDVIWRGTLPSPEGLNLDKLEKALLEVDGDAVLPAPLLDTGFDLDLLTGGKN